uniref:Uncharacterized protein n=1 Tax=Oryza glaberrima TaxID=4538 RepID=I1Q524_ORYGL
MATRALCSPLLGVNTLPSQHVMSWGRGGWEWDLASFWGFLSKPRRTRQKRRGEASREAGTMCIHNIGILVIHAFIEVQTSGIQKKNSCLF